MCKFFAVHFFLRATRTPEEIKDNTKRRDFFKLHLIFWRLKFININKIAGNGLLACLWSWLLCEKCKKWNILSGDERFTFLLIYICEMQNWSRARDTEAENKSRRRRSVNIHKSVYHINAPHTHSVNYYSKALWQSTLRNGWNFMRRYP